MDSYLEIAKKVLKEARQPLSAREILKAAYQLQIVPRDLYGRTQHKTLQARLATDILHHRGKGDFYRTGPGRFFLRALQNDHALPVRYRQEYLAPVRAAQLGRFDVLTISRLAIRTLASTRAGRLSLSDIATSFWGYHRMEETRAALEILPFRVTVVLLQDGKILLRQKRPGINGVLLSSTAVGFEGVIRSDDRSLFSEDDAGLMDAALRTLAEWLDLTPELLERLEPLRSYEEATVCFDERDVPASDDMMIILSFDCSTVPEVVEATQRTSTYEWQPFPLRTNDPGRFDRWAAYILENPSLSLGAAD
jgi:hypothetical protein